MSLSFLCLYKTYWATEVIRVRRASPAPFPLCPPHAVTVHGFFSLLSLTALPKLTSSPSWWQISFETQCKPRVYRTVVANRIQHSGLAVTYILPVTAVRVWVGGGLRNTRLQWHHGRGTGGKSAEHISKFSVTSMRQSRIFCFDSGPWVLGMLKGGKKTPSTPYGIRSLGRDRVRPCYSCSPSSGTPDRGFQDSPRHPPEITSWLRGYCRGFGAT